MYLEKHKKYRWNFPTQLIVIIMLYYLTPSSGVNFINILRARFLYESASCNFSLVHFGFIFFWQKDIGEKSAHKTLMTLPPVSLICADNREKHFRPRVIKTLLKWKTWWTTICTCSLFYGVIRRKRGTSSLDVFSINWWKPVFNYFLLSCVTASILNTSQLRFKFRQESFGSDWTGPYPFSSEYDGVNPTKTFYSTFKMLFLIRIDE